MIPQATVPLTAVVAALKIPPELESEMAFNPAVAKLKSFAKLKFKYILVFHTTSHFSRFVMLMSTPKLLAARTFLSLTKLNLKRNHNRHSNIAKVLAINTLFSHSYRILQNELIIMRQYYNESLHLMRVFTSIWQL